MSKKALITILKLLAVAALMVFVFSKVTWQDTLVTYDGEGEDRKRLSAVTGSVQGSWDVPQGEPILFREDLEGGGQGGAQPIYTGELPDGSGHVLEFEFGFLTYWANLNLGFFLLGALCYAITVFLAGTRWWWLLRVNGLGITLPQTWRYTWIGVFFNNVVPGATGGDLVKAIYAMKSCPGQRVPAMVSVIVDRVMGLASLALLCGIAVLFMIGDFTTIAIGVWAIIGGVGFLGVAAFSKRIRRLVRLNDLLEKLPPKASGLLKHVDEAVYYYRGHKSGIAVWLLIGMGNHVVSVFSVVFMGQALGVCMDTTTYLVAVPVANIASAIPLGPNGWGLREAVYGELFVRYGCAASEALRQTQGVALSVLYGLHMTLLSVFGGLGIVLGKDRVTREDVEKEMAAEEAEAEASEH